MKRKKFIIIIIAAAVLLAGSVTGYFYKQNPKPVDETTTVTSTEAEATAVTTQKSTEEATQTTVFVSEMLTEVTDDYEIAFDTSSKTIFLKGTNLGNYYSDNWTEWKKTAKKLVIEEGAVTIDDHCFRSFEVLETVELPSSLKKIGNFNFGECPKLKNIYVSSESSYFTSDDGILYNKSKTVLIKYPTDKANEEYSIPDTVTQVYRGAFYDNNNLKTIYIPKNSSGDLDIAFRYCFSLEKINVDPGNETYCSDSQGVMYTKDMKAIITIPYKIKEFVVPESVTDISNDCANFCDELKKITYHQNSTNIMESTFLFTALEEIEVSEKNKEYSSADGILYNKDKTELLYYPPMKEGKSFTVPDTVKHIDDLGGEKLETVTVPDNVKSFNYCAFLSCKSLKRISIGKGLEKIDFSGEFTVENQNPFRNSANLEKITVKNENNYFYSDEFGALYTKDMNHLLTVPASGDFTEYSVPDSVDGILDCFASCGKIEKINIGSEAKYICTGENGTESILGFYECVSLKSISVSKENPYFVSVDGVLFNKDKTELHLYPSAKEGGSYTVPKSVERIGDFAFAKNKNLKKLYIPADIGINFLWEFTNEDHELLIDIYYGGTKEQLGDSYLSDDPKMHFNAKGFFK